MLTPSRTLFLTDIYPQIGGRGVGSSAQITEVENSFNPDQIDLDAKLEKGLSGLQAYSLGNIEPVYMIFVLIGLLVLANIIQGR